MPLGQPRYTHVASVKPGAAHARLVNHNHDGIRLWGCAGRLILARGLLRSRRNSIVSRIRNGVRLPRALWISEKPPFYGLAARTGVALSAEIPSIFAIPTGHSRAWPTRRESSASSPRLGQLREEQLPAH